MIYWQTKAIEPAKILNGIFLEGLLLRNFILKRELGTRKLLALYLHE